jgi:hypothetical protein
MKTVFTILLSVLISTGFVPSKKKKVSDLAILKIETPTWSDDQKETVVEVVIKNKGKTKSLACRALLYDLDLSVEQGKDLGLNKLNLELLSENNSRAEYWQNNDNYAVDKQLNDYDEDFAVFAAIPALEPDETITLRFHIKDIWVYNSNCEIRVILDIDQTNNETHRSNNQKDFFAWG